MSTTTKPDDAKAGRAARVALHMNQGAIDNYTEVVKRAAVAGRISLAQAQADQVAAWRKQAEIDPLAGTGVLADWLEDADLVGAAPDPAEIAHEKALQNARMDPVHEGSVLLTDADRDEVREHVRAVAARHSTVAPITTDDGAVVAASDMDAVLSGDVTVPAGPAKADDAPKAPAGKSA